MNIEVAVLADSANIAAGDKLNVLGVFDTIRAARVPVVHPFMVLALRFRLEFEDGEKEHSLLVKMNDEDGKDFFKIDAKVKVPKIAAGTSHAVNQILSFSAITITKPGQFFFPITWDGDEVGKVILNVVLAPK